MNWIGCLFSKAWLAGLTALARCFTQRGGDMGLADCAGWEER